MPKPEKISRRPPRGTVALILFCFLYLTFTWTNFWNTNEYSRIFLTRALIEHQTFSIDKIIIHHDTQDKSFFRKNFYSNKAPISSFLAAPVYLAARMTQIYTGLRLSEPMLLYLITSLCLSIPSALFLLLLFKFWSLITLRYPLRRALLIAYALGTITWPYSTMYYGHQLAGMSLFIAFLITFSARELNLDSKTLFKSGFFCGLAFSIEYPTALISFCIFIYAATVGKKLRAALYLILAAFLIGTLWSQLDLIQSVIGPHIQSLINPRKAILIMAVVITASLGLPAISRAPKLLLFFLGCAIPVGVTFYYHWKCFGGPLQFPYYHETYRLFTIAHQRGIAGVSFPGSLHELGGQLSALFQLLISPYRGLFFYSPFLLLGLFGIVKMIRHPGWKQEGWLFLSITAVYFVFLSAFSDWEGGWSMGPRHLVPLLPFLVTAVIFQIGKSVGKIRRILAWILAPTALIAIAFVFIGTVVFPYFPKEFKNPLYDLSWLFLIQGKFAPTIGEICGLKGFARLIPLIVLTGVLMAILLLDLSREAYRRIKGRTIFCLFSVAIAAGFLFLAVLGSQWRTEKLSRYERVLQENQAKRVEAFMKR
ncbi:MAG: hypothetical protein RAO92_02705 [Candidatus Euphemobacter frigidus]|nr:hypothetical protein [Candidatus Euphemobacter frigidus]MDP8275290.1 hypothetical protein [Candidatus Euphemobacter frigidus]